MPQEECKLNQWPCLCMGRRGTQEREGGRRWGVGEGEGKGARGGRGAGEGGGDGRGQREGRGARE